MVSVVQVTMEAVARAAGVPLVKDDSLECALNEYSKSCISEGIGTRRLTCSEIARYFAIQGGFEAGDAVCPF